MIPCDCCIHEKSDNDAVCMSCVHTHVDYFQPAGKCATCEFDVRQYGICKRCVDFDMHTPKNRRAK
jgi:hypothetical protein